MKKKDKRGQVMVVTGATSGIGRATALEWARRGGNVVLAARSRNVLEEVASKCETYGGKAHVVQTDVTKEEEVESLAAEAVNAFGKIDVWLNDAAVLIFGEFTQIPTEDFRRILETNLFGFIYGARAAVRQFYKQDYGTLINMGSVSGIVGQPYSVPYSVSKGAIRSLSLSLGQELEGHEHIHVCTVHPSIVDTPVYDLAANYTGRAINPPTSATPPQEVVEAIIKLTKKPKREVFVGKLNLQMRLGRTLSPKLFDKAMRKVIEEFELTEEYAPETKGNLFKPNPRLAAVKGGWLKLEKEGERRTIRKSAGKAALITGLIVGIGWLLKKK
ncbi:SDR family NAD(P)-dependent oxidoreductase [Pontibacter diazotrophicus]|uniref:SDR family NAD(P)-dependent oxidoreductase n=1 Tax=Pontibacter diazotrophicus TaxID=1400979 RepID=A0A3D8L1N7_9BACT|nr:SDR family oxidoreductase [Pontibacter diazotrophicus]RDV11310.1 SDR family NAD(P)-dependent oxidoreductase [Pontibacter diazotrophicus]